MRGICGAFAAAAAGFGALGAMTGLGAAQEPSASDSEEIVVLGRARELYRVQEIESGKLPQEPLTSSLNVQVINSELIRDQGARDAQDLYRNLAGVTVFSYAGVTARGFRQEEIFFDGLRGDPYAGFSVPQLFNVARVEFLKGPASVLYGPAAPGGIFNYVTKKPQADFAARATVTVGTEARYGGSAEIEGAIPGLAGSAGRLGAFYETRNTPRFGADSDIGVFDAGVGFDLGFAELTLQGARYEQDLGANRLRGVPVNDRGEFLADRRWNHNEREDFLRLESDLAQARLDGAVGEAFVWNAAVRWNLAEEQQEYHEPFALIDEDADGTPDAVRREFRDQLRRDESVSLGANAIWSAQVGAIQNRLLVGGDWFEEDAIFDDTRARGGVPPLSLRNPQFGLSRRSDFVLQPRPRFNSTTTRYGVYLIEEATFGPLIATFGVRHDRFEDTFESAGEVSGFEDRATTLRAGLVYRVRPDVSLFAQWAESFEPQDAFDQRPEAGGPFDPTAGEIFEGGVKTALFDGRLQSTLAAYSITRSNILQPVDGESDLLTALGEVTSEGVELDFAADLTPNWVLTASYAYNDTRITADNGLGGFSNNVGDRFANAPENTFGFWTRYQIPSWGAAVAFGGDYIDVRQSLAGQKVQPYFVFDASLFYDFGPWSALLRVDNLFDETFAASGFTRDDGHFPGEPRSVFLEVSRAW